MSEHSPYRYADLGRMLDAIISRKACVVFLEFYASDRCKMSVRFSPLTDNASASSMLEIVNRPDTLDECDKVHVAWYEEVKYYGNVETWSLAALSDIETKLCDEFGSVKYLQLRRVGGKSVVWHGNVDSADNARRIVLDQLRLWQEEERGRNWFMSYVYSGVETQVFTRHEKVHCFSTPRQQMERPLSHASNPFEDEKPMTPVI